MKGIWVCFWISEQKTMWCTLELHFLCSCISRSVMSSSIEVIVFLLWICQIQICQINQIESDPVLVLHCRKDIGKLKQVYRRTVDKESKRKKHLRNFGRNWVCLAWRRKVYWVTAVFKFLKYCHVEDKIDKIVIPGEKGSVLLL